MKEEDKKLLLIDLCARLPYGVKIQRNSHYDPTKKVIEKLDAKEYVSDITYKNIERFEYKPYLRTISSMTKEEKDELFQLMGNGNDVQRMEFYHSHHLDCYGMIGKGLALEAPEDMYKF